MVYNIAVLLKIIRIYFLITMVFISRLPSPTKLKNLFPLTSELKQIKKKNDKNIASILEGKSKKLLLIIGPCSADRKDSVLYYMKRLRAVQEKVSTKIVIVPRLYTGKPRTHGNGYKGMLHNPDPIGPSDLIRGLAASRDLHLSVLRETGFSCADELLYPANYDYLDDLLSYVAIGARSSENQEHRMIASGVEVPVGMKNPANGDFGAMLNSVNAARMSHTFIYRDTEVRSSGNRLAHGVLRGYTDCNGISHSNCDYGSLVRLYGLLPQYGLDGMPVIIDTNHDNSGKDYLKQIEIAEKVVRYRNESEEIKSMVRGLMIESYIKDGSQPVCGEEYGMSITDPCLGWEKTEKLIFSIADILREQ